MNARLIAGLALVALVTASCGGSAAGAPVGSISSRPPAATPSVRATVSIPPGSDDVAQLDRAVRRYHPSPFANHSEAEWTATVGEVSASIDTAAPNQRIVLLASLMGLLDTHSSVVSVPDGWHFYDLLPYRFSDGWFVIRADDPSLVGDRLIGIAGVPIEAVVQRLTPLVPHDNPDGLLEGIVWLVNSIEYLNGAGIVDDPTSPHFELEQPSGTRLTVDPLIQDEQSYSLFGPGWLSGQAPEAVARRGEHIWTRLDAEHRTFLIAVNDYGDTSAAQRAMTAALDAGTADRVVFDMRYLQGGSGEMPILDALKSDKRVNRPGSLFVLIGRENVSAATDVAEFFDRETEAMLLGEPTPARADNFRCDCRDIRLTHSGIVVSVPTFWERNGDERLEIPPDVPMPLRSADFFAGRDPVLAAAMSGVMPTGS